MATPGYRSIVAAMFWAILVAYTAPAAAQGAPKGGSTTANDEQTAEFQRLVGEMRQAAAEGQHAKAVVACQKLLALQKQADPNGVETRGKLLMFLADLQRSLDNLAAEKTARQEVLSIHEKLYGKQDWRVHDARLALYDLTLLQKLSKAQRQQLLKAQADAERASALVGEGKLKEAVELLEQCVATRKAILGEQHRTTVDNQNYLAVVYQKSGDAARAEPLMKQVVEVRKKTLGEAHPEYARAMKNLGSLLATKGSYDEAAELIGKALSIHYKALGANSPEYIDGMQELGYVHELNGDMAKAAAIYGLVADVVRQSQGQDSPEYAALLNLQATAFHKAGQFDKALPLYGAALTTYAKSADKDPAGYLETLDLLTQHFFDRGKPDDAVKVCTQAIEIRKKLWGEEDLRTITQMVRLSELYQSQKELDKAELLLRQALELVKKGHGEKDPNYAAILHRLARLALLREQPDEALNYYRQSSDSLKQAGRSDSVDYAQVLLGWAVLCRQQGDYSQAVALSRQAVDGLREGKHEADPQFVPALYELARTYQAAGDYAQAEPLYREIVEVRRQTVGEADPQFAASQMILAQYFASLGDYRQAAELYEQAGAILEKQFGPKSLEFASSLKQRADMYYEMRMFAKCAPLYRQIVDIRKALSGAEDAAYLEALADLAKMLADMGQSDEAEPLVSELLETRKKLSGEVSPEYAAAVNDASMIYYALKNEQRGDELVQQSIAILKQVLGDKDIRTIRGMGDWAAFYRDRGNYDRAEQLYAEALETVRAGLGEKVPAYFECLEELGNLKKRAGNYDEAERLLKKAVELSQQLSDAQPELHGKALVDLALLYYQREDDVQGDVLAEQSRQWVRKISGDSPRRLAAEYGGWATFHADRGDYARSLPLRRQSVELYKQSVGENHVLYARALSALASLLSNLGDSRGALPLMLQSAEILERTEGELHADTAVAMSNLGMLYLMTGDVTRGADCFQKAQRIRRQIFGENHLALVDSLLENAIVFQGLKLFDMVEPLYQQAIEILEKHEEGPRDQVLANTLASYSDFCLEQGNFAQAEPLLRRSLEIKKRLGTDANAHSQNELAQLYVVLNRPGEAVPLALDAVRSMRRRLSLTAAVQSERQQLNMARQLRNYLDTYLSAALATKVPADQLYQEVLNWKGVVFAQQRMQRLRSRAQSGEIAQQAAELLQKLERRSSELASLVRLSTDTEQAGVDSQRLEQVSSEIEQLQSELAALDAGASKTQPAKSLVVAELQKLLPAGTLLIDLLQFEREMPPTNGESKPSRETQVIAFLVRADKPLALVELGKAETLDGAIEKWREAVGDPPQKSGGTGDELRKLLWQPLETHAQGCATVLISPDGPLARLPWGALPGAKPDTYLLEDYAIAMLPVAQSLVELLAPRKAESGNAGNAGMLLVGDVDFGGAPGEAGKLAAGQSRAAPRGVRGSASSWQALPGTTKEAASIRSVFEKSFGKQKLKSLERDQATESHVRSAAPDCRYLHLATHGFFSPTPEPNALVSLFGTLMETTAVAESLAFDADDAPRDKDRVGTSRMFRPDRGVSEVHPGLLSGIVLAGANAEVQADRDDGILTALEVGQLDLGRLDLVTLSACETGLGEAAGGEGLLGLQRAFQVAGARSVVASLWQVPDDATRVLMSEFFENLWVKKLSKIEALRQAQLTVLRRYDPRSGSLRGLTVASPTPAARTAAGLPPLYWAAFVLSGDWR